MKQPVTQTPVKDFFLRGLLFGGFGPVVLGIVYLILQYTLEDLTLTGDEVFLGIIYWERSTSRLYIVTLLI